MIYRFNLISDEVDDFKLEIQIDSDDTFLSLRNVILDAAGYTKDQMDSFIICDEEWNKEKEVTAMKTFGLWMRPKYLNSLMTRATD